MNDEIAGAAAAVNAARLRSHLERSGLGVAGPLQVRLISGGRSNLTCRVTDGESRWILRRPPLGDFAAGAHDVGREFKVMAALVQTEVPVPVVVLDCADPSIIGAPFYLMEEVLGRVIRTPGDAADISRERRHDVGARLVGGLADLHAVDFHRIGLGSLGRPDRYLERQVSRWIRQLESVRRRELRHIDALAHILRSGLPASTRATVVHGDYRLDNVIVGLEPVTELRAILDWEMATIGDPLADLATMLMFWDVPGRPFNPITRGLMAEPGFPTPEEAISLYRERRDVELADFDWYLVFARFKLAVILEQIRVRHEDGNTLGVGFDQLASAVDGLLTEAFEQACESASLTPPVV